MFAVVSTGRILMAQAAGVTDSMVASASSELRRPGFESVTCIYCLRHPG